MTREEHLSCLYLLVDAIFDDKEKLKSLSNEQKSKIKEILFTCIDYGFESGLIQAEIEKSQKNELTESI